MPNRYLLESGAPDGYLLEDSSGVLVMESDYAQSVLELTPVAYWRLGESTGTVAKDSKSTNDGTYVGAPTLGATGALAGDSNTAVTLNGTTQWATVPDATVFDFGDGPQSVVVWARRTGGVDGYQVVYNGGGVNSLGSAFRQSDSKFTLSKVGVSDIVSETGTTPTDGVWHMWAWTRTSGGTQLLYKDGVDVTGTVTGATIADTTTGPIIGANAAGANRLIGDVDEVAVFNTVLTPAQVAALYNAAAGWVPYRNPMPPLIAQ